MTIPRALVIRTAGTNCDAEMCRAFEMAGAAAELVHVDRLIAEPSRVESFDLIGFPGGFSYGDDIASGRILAMKLREKLYPALRDAARRGVPMIGACNGFQVLVQVGLLPGPNRGPGASPGSGDGAWPEDAAPAQTASLSFNSGGRFIDTWVRVKPNPDSPCIWTRGLVSKKNAEEPEQPENTRGGNGFGNASTVSSLVPSGLSGPSAFLPGFAADAMMLPIAHGEGRFVTASAGVLEDLRASGQIALTYAPDDNPNGSEQNIAGICDAGGRIFGLMPHPERYLDWTLHPFWTRLGSDVKQGGVGPTPGLKMFQNAVRAVARVGA
jgi:phosphoribosylformylglycinamidine synthase